MAHDVFISHASKDKKTADAVCEKLESVGTRCWIAPRDLSTAEDWTEAVRNAIDAFSPPPEQHLETLTARIKGLLLGLALTSKALPPHSAKKTAATLNSLNSWEGELRSSHSQTRGTLKAMATAASVIAGVWLLRLASEQTEQGASPEESKLPSI